MESVNKPIYQFITILPEEQMNMIWHETVRKERDFVLLEIFTEALEVPAVVLCIIKNDLLIVPTIIHMIEALRIKNRWSS